VFILGGVQALYKRRVCKFCFISGVWDKSLWVRDSLALAKGICCIYFTKVVLELSYIFGLYLPVELNEVNF